MATKVEWRRNLGTLAHTGSVEVNNGTNKPVLYAHPLDAIGYNYSPAAGWVYSQNDGRDATVAGKSLALTVAGVVSYTSYANLFARWARAGFLKRLALRIALALDGQSSPADVFGAPIANNLQPSGSLRYEAFLSLDPPDPQDQTVDIRVALAANATTPGFGGAAGSGGTLASAQALDGNTDVDRVSALGPLAGAPAQDAKTVTYAVTIPAGGDVRVALVDVGPAFMISGGLGILIATASADIQA